MAKERTLELLLIAGIPASGKSTWAKEYVRNHDNWIRVSRDDFRFMLKDMPVCDPKIEDLINGLQANMIMSALRKNLNVIVDNTNLKASYINPIIELVQYTADVKFQLFDISVDKAVERDNNREKKVGRAVIEKMFKQYKIFIDSFDFSARKKKPLIYKNPKFNSDLPNAVVFDVDGTLAHMDGKRGPFDWHKVDRDNVDDVIARQARVHKAYGDKVLIVTGRDGSCKQMTIDWLNFYEIPFDDIFTRPADDYRKDSIIKTEIYNNNLKGKFNVIMVYDDRNQVVDMWREIGLKVAQVENGNF